MNILGNFFSIMHKMMIHRDGISGEDGWDDSIIFNENFLGKVKFSYYLFQLNRSSLILCIFMKGNRMSTQKKACVIYTKGFETKLSAVTGELADKGYNVCVSLVEQAEAEAAQAGKIQELNSDVKACIEGADICIFLIPEKNAECLAGAADHAKGSGTRIIAVVENLESIPEIFDEYASSVVSGGSSKLEGAVLGGDVWEAEKESAGGRKIQRVKCQ